MVSNFHVIENLSKLLVCVVQKLQDGGEIDLKLLGEALSGENEVIEVDFRALLTLVRPWLRC